MISRAPTLIIIFPILFYTITTGECPIGQHLEKIRVNTLGRDLEND